MNSISIPKISAVILAAMFAVLTLVPLSASAQSAPTTGAEEAKCIADRKNKSTDKLKASSIKALKKRLAEITKQEGIVLQQYTPGKQSEKEIAAAVKRANARLAKLATLKAQAENTQPVPVNPVAATASSHKDALLAEIYANKKPVEDTIKRIESDNSSGSEGIAKIYCQTLSQTRIYSYLQGKVAHQIKIDKIYNKNKVNQVNYDALKNSRRVGATDGLPNPADAKAKIDSELQARLDSITIAKMNSGEIPVSGGFAKILTPAIYKGVSDVIASDKQKIDGRITEITKADTILAKAAKKNAKTSTTKKTTSASKIDVNLSVAAGLTKTKNKIAGTVTVKAASGSMDSKQCKGKVKLTFTNGANTSSVSSNLVYDKKASTCKGKFTSKKLAEGQYSIEASLKGAKSLNDATASTRETVPNTTSGGVQAP